MRQPLRIKHFAPPGGRPAPAIRPICGDLIEVDVDRPHRWERHRHPDYEALIIERGTYRCLLSEVRVEVPTGHLLLVKPGDSHVDLLDPPLRYVALQFDLEAARGTEPLLFAPDASPAAQVVSVDAGIRAALARLRAVAEDPSLAAAGMREALLAEFFWRIVGALPQAALARPFRAPAGDQDFARRLQTAIDGSVDSPRSVTALAAQLGMTAAAFTHRCRDVLGMPPARALRNRRMDHARVLVERSAAPLKTIAERLGFDDQFHFSRAFKRRHGFPPSLLRREGR